MNTSFWTPYITDGTMNAICWTLIHSLWIGLIIALITGLMITLTRKSTAALRYRLLCGMLVLFVLSVSVVFYIEKNQAGSTLSAAHTVKTVNHQFTFVAVNHVNISPQVSFVDSVVSFLNQNTAIIFLVWLLFFALKSLKMVSELLYIHRVRNYKVHAVADEFKETMEQFCQQIGIKRAVRLVQSELVKVPVAVGWLKPVILLPMGIILQLPAEQLESILWHELAHIRRRDYLVNILQGAVETVFFFNPALLWLSSLIRAEREACCDDMVLSRMNRKANYFEALLAFGYGEFKTVKLAMSVGSGNQLRNRLKRLVNQENKRLSIAEKAVLSAGLILLLAFTAFPKVNQAANLLEKVIAKKSAPITPKSRVIAHAPDTTLAGERMHPLEKVAIKQADTSIHFTSVLFKNGDADLANNEISAMDDKGNEYHLIVSDNKLTAMEINGVKVADDKLPGYAYLIRDINSEIARKRQIQAEDMAAFKAQSPKAKFKDNDSLAFYKRKYTADMRGYKDMRLKLRQKFAADSGAPRFKRFGADIQMKLQDDANDEANLARVDGVIGELVKEKIVPNPSAVVWFGLSDTQLIVNGEKQPAALQQKLAAAYGVHKDYGLYYGPVQMSGRGVFIDVPPPQGLLLKRKMGQLRLNEQRLSLQDQKIRFRDDLKLQAGDIKFKIQKLKLADPGFKMWKKDSLMLHNEREWGKLRQRFPLTQIPLNPIISNVIDDLLSENILNDKNSLSSFNLTNSYLVVNGIKQSSDIHKKLKSRYLVDPQYPLDPKVLNDPHFGIHYDVKSGMGIGITEGPDSR